MSEYSTYFITKLPEGDQCVGIVEHQGQLFVSTQKSVYRLTPTNTLVPVLFEMREFKE